MPISPLLVSVHPVATDPRDEQEQQCPQPSIYGQERVAGRD